LANKRKSAPAFASEAAEREFWNRMTPDHIDWSKAKRARFSQSETVDDGDFAPAADGAAGSDQGSGQQARCAYQSLIKAWLAEKVGR